ncbi:hypothetical protein, partial [Mesonia phycicola]|uniref:hypothetical protein n=1 Tax=Mesonia phycicola TaxID=579105 RepID=UPI001F2E14F6
KPIQKVPFLLKEGCPIGRGGFASSLKTSREEKNPSHLLRYHYISNLSLKGKEVYSDLNKLNKMRFQIKSGMTQILIIIE